MVACNAISRAVHPLGVLPPAGTRRAVALLQRESPGTGVPKPSEGRFGIFKAPLRRLRKHLPDVSHLLGYSPCLGFLPPRHVGKASAALGVAPSANRHFVSCEDSKAILDETSGTRGSQEAAVGSSDAVEVDRMQPTRCSGCGAPLQTDDENAIGFVPKSKLDEFSGGRIKALPRPRGEVVDAVPDGVEVIQVTLHALGIRLQELGVGAVLMTAGTPQQSKAANAFMLTGFLLSLYDQFPSSFCGTQHYRNIDSAWESSAVTSSGMLPALSASSVITHLTRLMPKNSIILKIVDICDLELSVVPELFEACRQKGLKTLWIINRVDWFGFEALEKRIGDLLSAEAGDIEAGGIHTEADGRLMFVVGRVNAGKSTFVNRFLKFVGYKHFGTLFLKRAVGGATRSALPGTTLDLMPFGLPKGFKLVDTPGIPSSSQITNLLPHGPDLLAVVPSKRLQPVTYALTEGKSLLIGAMARIDLVEGRTALCTCFFSHKITLHICKTSRATDLLRRKACAFLYPPHLPEGFQRLQPLVRHRVKVYSSGSMPQDDLSIGGLGWMSVGGSGSKLLDVWLPKGVKLFRRPAMIPSQIKRTGVTHFKGKSMRARGPRISARKRQLALEMRQETGREQMEREQRDGDAGTEREDDSGLRDIETRLPLVNEDGSKELQKLVAEWEGEQQKL
ncbi:hypothetical protein cyc_05762 [Cyclospora cayetanensis]|uniref:Uncharacterized protein n=1 Tax=Cyclospora cayetanensis TaxID=88456 RepID=A0A1D3D116_9EIME|nr:hypothetical protein cyc_05762 [Cyclospora cayetanensis]